MVSNDFLTKSECLLSVLSVLKKILKFFGFRPKKALPRPSLNLLARTPKPENRVFEMVIESRGSELEG